jgi:hypothetical protein
MAKNVFTCQNYEIEKIFEGIEVRWTHYVLCFQSRFQKATLKRNGILCVEIEAKDADFIARGWEVKWDKLPQSIKSQILALRTHTTKTTKSTLPTVEEFAKSFWAERR